MRDHRWAARKVGLVLVGVNLHPFAGSASSPYANWPLVEAALNDLRPVSVRTALGSYPAEMAMMRRHLEWCRDNGADAVVQVPAVLDMVAVERELGPYRDVVYAVEGHNEPDLFWPPRRYIVEWKGWRPSIKRVGAADWRRKVEAHQRDLAGLSFRLLTPAAGRLKNEAFCLRLPGEPCVHRYATSAVVPVGAVVTECGVPSRGEDQAEGIAVQLATLSMQGAVRAYVYELLERSSGAEAEDRLGLYRVVGGEPVPKAGAAVVRAARPPVPPEPDPEPEPEPEEPPVPPAPPVPDVERFRVGLHTGDRPFDYGAVRALLPGFVRVGGLSSETSVEDVERIAREYGVLGASIVPLVDFNGAAPSTVESERIAAWAGVRGVDAIEFGNEPWLQNEAWDYAQYAASYKALQDAVRASGSRVPVIAVADPANRGHRPALLVLQALKAIGCKPDVVQCHPYGPGFANRVGDLRRDLADVGWMDVPIWATETGMATDDGRTMLQGGVPNNYGWDPEMTFEDAAFTLGRVVEGLRGLGVQRVVLYMGTDYRAHGETSEREHYFGLTGLGNAEKGALTVAARRVFGAYR